MFGFVRRSNLRSVVERVRRSQALKTSRERDEYWMQRMDSKINELNEGYEYKLSIKDEEIRNLEIQLSNQYKTVEKAKNVYYACLKKIKENARLKADLEFNAKRITASVGEIESTMQTSIRTVETSTRALDEVAADAEKQLNLSVVVGGRK